MSIPTKKRTMSLGLAFAALLIPMVSLAQALTTTNAAQSDLIFYGGDVVTMDKEGTVAQAALIRDGKIVLVGKRDEVMQYKTKTTQLIDLRGGALLPGFVEPHLHLDVVTLMSFYVDVNPCLPDRYETRKSCPLTIFEALDFMKTHRQSVNRPWFVGNGIDPALMSLDGSQPSSLFQANPAKYIDEHVSKTQPVIILDKSGHLAFANLQAFVAAGICKNVDECGPKTTPKALVPASPGQWIVGDDGRYTGLLLEPEAYVAFTQAVNATNPPTPQEVMAQAQKGAQAIAQTGVTTFVNGGTVNLGADFLSQVAALSKDHPLLRYRTLVPWNGGATPVQPTPWDESTGAIFGVTGIKLWADGSAQGCTAALKEPYASNGPCAGNCTGNADFTTPQIISFLQPFWRAGWPIQIHTNGDRGIQNVLNALAALQIDARNNSPIVLLHFTVDGNPANGEDMVQQLADLRAGRFLYQGKVAPPVNVSVSHLIGHVAYWGGAFQSILDGVNGPEQSDPNGRAARLDATRHELELGVPFSLHSDATVTPTNPLWYVEQAVTRNTWFYPHLRDSDQAIMPGRQNITIAQALEAVTIEPARQNQLDRYIGSIEEGKVADLVVLDKNPLQQTPNAIHCIRVLSTFIGGVQNDWSEHLPPLAADCPSK